MSVAPAGSGWSGRIRAASVAVLVLLALFIWLKGPWAERLQAAWFDTHQTLWPRQPTTLPVIVVAIDAKSLSELGQWPWPRNLLAQLVRTINRAGPTAIGINILMPESDALSPERFLARSQGVDKSLIDALRAMPTHDAQLALVLSTAPAVLVVAGTPEAAPEIAPPPSPEPATQTPGETPGKTPGKTPVQAPAQAKRPPLRAAPVTVHSVHAAAGGAAPGEPGVPRYAGALSSIAELDQQASGWGLISVQSSRGLIRSMPLVASIDGTLLPSLAVEMLRVEQHLPSLRLAVSGTDVTGVSIGRYSVPTESDASVRVYFSPHLEQRFVSAADVLAGRVDEARLRDRLVLIGLTATGLQEYQNTPMGERLPGTEIHAQLLENLLDDTLLRRPPWASAFEATLLLLLGGVLLWATPRWRTQHTAWLLLACVAVPVLLAFAAFRSHRLLFDALTPGLSLLLFFGLLLALTLAESTRQGRVLQRALQAQREDGARLSGELQAAQRVQTATLPRSELLRADRRIDLYATLQPAREVGGDLYDFFILDAHRLFVLIGDVSGKGLSASIFMAVSKALYKSAMLRAPDADIGAIMVMANAEVSRDNPGSLFVTAFAAILDLDDGVLSYCNAGHDNPFRLHASYPLPLRIDDGDGPPLCALPGYDYRGARCTLLPGEMLCLMTDGVSEAQTAGGQLYGTDRLQRLLLQLQRDAVGARALVDALQADVIAFAGGAEPADDLTILALRWNGPQGAAR